ncbi:MAG: PadR family transcriptional regulator [Chloroflexi bacterium]|nr:PadR family transcriptional regulator [Chloroflexota bacterium]
MQKREAADRPEAYPVTYGVLGLLAFWGPMSGYDIKRLFDHVLSPMWGAAHSQIYNELRRMKDLGWVEMEREEQESRPDRKVYHMTAKGREALATWQTRPAGMLQIRDELMLKIMFGAFAPPGALAANLRESIAQHEMRLLAYRQNSQYIPVRGKLPQENVRNNPYTSEGEEDPFFSLLVRFAIDFEKIYLSWLREMLAFVEENEQQDVNEPDR